MSSTIPSWMKSGVFIILCIIIWDLIRIPLQALVNKWIMKSSFDKVVDEVVEEVIEEENKTDDTNDNL